MRECYLGVCLWLLYGRDDRIGLWGGALLRSFLVKGNLYCEGSFVETTLNQLRVVSVLVLCCELLVVCCVRCFSVMRRRGKEE